MITQFLIIVILYLILNQVIQYYNDISNKNINSEENTKEKVEANFSFKRERARYQVVSQTKKI